MKSIPNLVLFYGILLLVGGLIGFYKANSTMSLIMGSTCAVLAFASSIGIRNKKVSGYAGATLLAILLTLFFTYRFFKTFALMPSGLMAVISLIMVITLIKERKSAYFLSNQP